MIDNNYLQVIKVGGNISTGNYPLFHSTGLKFLEVGGTISGNDNVNYQTSGSWIVHLSYNGVACAPGRLLMTRVSTVYVGPGESEAGDQAILDEYLADTNWSAYSSKLATWSSYSGQYKTE